MHDPFASGDVQKMSLTELLTDFADLEPFANEIKKHPRTVRRWMNEPNGLPYTSLGNRILIHIPTAREWMLARMRHRNSRRSKAA
jgi:hypothetical protein